jgi:cytochrome c biogenesis protein CcdA
MEKGPMVHSSEAASPRTSIKRILALVVGGAVGFGIAFLLYGWLNPVLEARRDWLRELQGALFTLIPLFTVAGSALGWSLGKTRRRASSR